VDYGGHRAQGTGQGAWSRGQESRREEHGEGSVGTEHRAKSKEHGAGGPDRRLSDLIFSPGSNWNPGCRDPFKNNTNS
jgi:hypothetical protein